jgi:hypothetical protein
MSTIFNLIAHIAHRRYFGHRGRGAALIVIAAVASLTCGTPRHETADTSNALPGKFADEIRSAQANGIRVYWLGAQFTTEGLTFQVTDVADKPDLYGFGEELLVEYVAEAADGSLLLPVSLQTREDWQSWEGQRAAALRGYTQLAVDMPPWDAVLYVKPGLSPNWKQVRLVVDTGDTVVSTDPSPTIAKSGRQIDPFINNPDLLVQVIGENLRPYPE